MLEAFIFRAKELFTVSFFLFGFLSSSLPNKIQVISLVINLVEVDPTANFPTEFVELMLYFGEASIVRFVLSLVLVLTKLII
jgi:hypothetical protein